VHVAACRQNAPYLGNRRIERGDRIVTASVSLARKGGVGLVQKEVSAGSEGTVGVDWNTGGRNVRRRAGIQVAGNECLSGGDGYP
jgi:hypothetical protein